MQAMVARTKSAQRGLSLVEVLITLVVLAIGLLGLAGLQASSLKNNQSAYYRSQAVMLADDIMDRMRANRQAARNGDYNLGFTNSPSSQNAQAQTDLVQWRARVQEVLPAGTSSVQVNGTTERATVRMRWNDQRLESETGNTTITVRSRL